jgi:hypothetical protein
MKIRTNVRAGRAIYDRCAPTDRCAPPPDRCAPQPRCGGGYTYNLQ